jgi:hypothetical protein
MHTIGSISHFFLTLRNYHAPNSSSELIILLNADKFSESALQNLLLRRSASR